MLTFAYETTRSYLARADMELAFSTGNPASDQKLDAAANAAWPYAKLCAWTYLNDHAAAHDIMDHAVENASGYISRHADCPEGKLILRFKSVIRRRAAAVCKVEPRDSIWLSD